MLHHDHNIPLPWEMKQCLDQSTPTTLRGVSDISDPMPEASDNRKDNVTSNNISEANVLGLNSHIIKEDSRSMTWNTLDKKT
jgi:hypothetical protein